MSWDSFRKVSDLIGKTLTEIKQIGTEKIIFKTEDGLTYKMYHERDCCEEVWIEDICGELNSLVGSPIVMAEEATNSESDQWGDSTTWTFYKFATVNGYVTIRWCGQSNGYYSESVDFALIEGNDGRRDEE